MGNWHVLAKKEADRLHYSGTPLYRPPLTRSQSGHYIGVEFIEGYIWSEKCWCKRILLASRQGAASLEGRFGRGAPLCMQISVNVHIVTWNDFIWTNFCTRYGKISQDLCCFFSLWLEAVRNRSIHHVVCCLGTGSMGIDLKTWLWFKAELQHYFPI